MNLALVQARMSSSRLPGKVLLPILGKPMLEHLLSRLKYSKTIDKIVVATSDSQEDEEIEALCTSLGVAVFRGSLEDVLDRYYRAAQTHKADVLVRITGDCPLIDPAVVDEVVRSFHKARVDYASNTIQPTFPDGLDVEVFSYAALKTSWENAKLASHREHVTLYIKDHPQQFSLLNVENTQDLSAWRLTVDEHADYELVKEVFAACAHLNRNFSLADMMKYLKSKPEAPQNSSIARDEGLLLSRCQDALDFVPAIDRTLAAQARAKRRIPGETQLLSKRANQFSEGIWPAYFSRAKGALVWDLDDNCYLDMSIGGIGATILGYADDDVDRAVIEAIQTGVASSLSCPQELEFSDVLCEMHPWSDMARLARTGGEAMAIAVRIARAHTEREKVLICGYHGWHDWYLAANLGDENQLAGHLLPGLDALGVPQSLAGSALTFPYNDLATLEKLLSENSGEVAAIVMEPVRSHMPAEGFLAEVKRLAHAHGALLIFDEVSSGFRFCAGGAHLQLGVDPDLAVFSKSIANGYAMAALIGREAVMRKAEDSFISSTCWTEKVGPAAALACIKKFVGKDVATHLSYCGERVKNAWLEQAQRNDLPIVVAGLNPICSFTLEVDDFAGAKALFVQVMLSQGILASNSYYAMYSHTEEYIDRYIDALEVAFKVLSLALLAGDLRSKLKGAPSVPGFGRLVK